MRAYTITWPNETFTMPAISTSNGWYLMPPGFEKDIISWDPSLKGKKSFGRSHDGQRHATRWRELRLSQAVKRHPGQMPIGIEDQAHTIDDSDGVTVIFDHPVWGMGSVQLRKHHSYYDNSNDEPENKGKTRFAYRLHISPLVYAFGHISRAHKTTLISAEGAFIKQAEAGSVLRMTTVYYTLEEARQAVTDFMVNPIKTMVEETSSFAKNHASGTGDQQSIMDKDWTLKALAEGLDWENVDWPSEAGRFYGYQLEIPANGTRAFIDDTLITYSQKHRKPFLLKSIPHWMELGKAFIAAEADGVTVNYDMRYSPYGDSEITEVEFIFDIGDGVKHTITISETGLELECGWQTEEQRLISQHKHQIKESGIDSLLFGE